MASLYREFLFRPILNALVLLYGFLPFHDLGIAIILLTLLIRLLLLPFSYKAARAQKELAKIQPKLKEIQKKFKNNREEQAKQLMELYRSHRINPMSAIVPIIVQLPILIALYRVFIMTIKGQELIGLYSFVRIGEAINPYFLGIVNLAEKSVPLAIVAGLTQFIYAKLTMTKVQKDKKSSVSSFSSLMSNQMTFLMPAMIIFFGLSMPAGLPLYWIASTLFGIGEQLVVKRRKDNYAPEDEEKSKKNKYESS